MGEMSELEELVDDLSEPYAKSDEYKSLRKKKKRENNSRVSSFWNTNIGVCDRTKSI